MTPENEVQNVLPCLARIIREQFIHILSVVSAKISVMWWDFSDRDAYEFNSQII